jgi:hypothetical protein
MTDFGIPMVRTRPVAAAALTFAHLALSVLIVVSVIEASLIIAKVSHLIANLHDPLLIGPLAAALLPCAGVGFWASKAIIAQLDRGFAGLRRHRQQIPEPPRANSRTDGSGAELNQCLAIRPRERKAGAGLWIGAAFLVALGLAVAGLATTGIDANGIRQALRQTARFSFLLFWPAYSASAVATLFGTWAGPLARRGRDFGLAYASAQLVHFTLVVTLARVAHLPLVAGLMPFFAIGLVWTFVLAVSSIDRWREVFGADFWRILRSIGVEYIALVFFADFVLNQVGNRVELTIAYLPFSTLLIAGALLRAAAIVRRLASDWAAAEVTWRAPSRLRKIPPGPT